MPLLVFPLLWLQCTGESSPKIIAYFLVPNKILFRLELVLLTIKNTDILYLLGIYEEYSVGMYEGYSEYIIMNILEIFIREML